MPHYHRHGNGCIVVSSNMRACAPRMDRLISANHTTAASWRSGDAADCKSVYTGSIPVLASTLLPHKDRKPISKEYARVLS